MSLMDTFSLHVPVTVMELGPFGGSAASATVMLATVAAIVVPYLYSELRVKK